MHIIIPGAPPETTVGLGGLTPDAVVNQNDGDNPAYLALVGSAVGDARIATSVWTLEDGGDMDASSPFAVASDRLTTALALATMTVGVTYTFRLTVTDVQGDSAYGEVKVTINAPPSSGSCALAPIKGWALMSDYTFRCVNWVDDDLPLGYEFRAQPSGVTSRSPLADTQQDPSFTSLLPQGDSAYNYTVLGWTDVVDYYSASTRSSSEVRVLPYSWYKYPVEADDGAAADDGFGATAATDDAGYRARARGGGAALRDDPPVVRPHQHQHVARRGAADSRRSMAACRWGGVAAATRATRRRRRRRGGRRARRCLRTCTSARRCASSRARRRRRAPTRSRPSRRRGRARR